MKFPTDYVLRIVGRKAKGIGERFIRSLFKMAGTSAVGFSVDVVLSYGAAWLDPEHINGTAVLGAQVAGYPIKTGGLLVYERLWAGVQWGRNPRISEGGNPARDRWYRSVAYTLGWRIVSGAMDSAVLFFTTGNLKFSISFVGTKTVVKMGTFFLHERAWTYIRRGMIVNQTESLSPAVALKPGGANCRAEISSLSMR